MPQKTAPVKTSIEIAGQQWTKRQILDWVDRLNPGRPSDKAVLRFLARCANKSGEAFVSQQQIARDVAACERTVRYVLDRLAAAGAVKASLRYHADGGGRIASKYTLSVGSEPRFTPRNRPHNQAYHTGNNCADHSGNYGEVIPAIIDPHTGNRCQSYKESTHSNTTERKKRSKQESRPQETVVSQASSSCQASALEAPGGPAGCQDSFLPSDSRLEAVKKQQERGHFNRATVDALVAAHGPVIVLEGMAEIASRFAAGRLIRDRNRLLGLVCGDLARRSAQLKPTARAEPIRDPRTGNTPAFDAMWAEAIAEERAAEAARVAGHG